MYEYLATNTNVVAAKEELNLRDIISQSNLPIATLSLVFTVLQCDRVISAHRIRYLFFSKTCLQREKHGSTETFMMLATYVCRRRKNG